MTADTQALAPCPFCGHEHPSFERLGTSRQSCIVVCGNCGCRHESSDEYGDSGRSWNERAGTQEGEPSERATFVSWLSETYPRSHDRSDAEHYWKHDHVSALAWKYRAALAQAQKERT